MRISSLAVFYLWTNLYTVNNGFLLQPFIRLHKRRQSSSSSSQRLSQENARDVKHASINAHSDSINFIKGKRFFEFHPFAFARRKFSKPGDKSFLFDSKRFFQYSPFISRLQRSHVHKPKVERPKQTHKPHFYTSVVDHFTGSKIPSEKLPQPHHGWTLKPRFQPGMLADKSTFIVNHEKNNGNRFPLGLISNAIKSNEHQKDIFQPLEKALQNRLLHTRPLNKDRFTLQHNKGSWGSYTDPLHTNKPHILFPGSMSLRPKQTNTIIQSDNNPGSKHEMIWGEASMQNENSQPDPEVGNGLFQDDTTKLSEFKNEKIPGSPTKSYNPTNKLSASDTKSGLGEKNDFGSFGHVALGPAKYKNTGFGDVSPPIHNNVNHQTKVQGVWGSFAEDITPILTPEKDFAPASIPVPPLGLVGDKKVSG